MRNGRTNSATQGREWKQFLHFCGVWPENSAVGFDMQQFQLCLFACNWQTNSAEYGNNFYISVVCGPENHDCDMRTLFVYYAICLIVLCNSKLREVFTKQQHGRV